MLERLARCALSTGMPLLLLAGPRLVGATDTADAAAVGEATIADATPSGAGEPDSPEAPRYHEEVRVHGDPLGEPVSSQPVAPEEVRAVAGGAENVFRVLTTLPGVAATDDFSSRLSVRGGGPDQNLTVMDGVEVHDPYRLFGLVSAFNPETVESFELVTGAFGARYGDRLSSILVIENREGSTRRAVSGSSALSLTDANAILEGRLPKASGSWLLTGRRTYYDLVAEPLTDSSFPSFSDVQGKLSLDLRRGRRLTVTALWSREATDASLSGGSHQGEFYTRTRNDLLSLRYDRPLGTRGTWRTLVAWYDTGDDKDIDGRFRGGLRLSNTPDRDDVDAVKVVWSSSTRVSDLSLRQETTFGLTGSQQGELGFEVHHLGTRVDYAIDGARSPMEANGSSLGGGAGLASSLDSARDDTRIGGWLIHRLRLGTRLQTETGLRLDRSTINGELELLPRFQASLALGSKSRLRLAAGQHTQSPGYEKLVSADNFADLSGAGRLAVRNERSTHAVLGLERELLPGLTARVEGYYKSFSDLVVGRLETPEQTAARTARYDFAPELAASVPSDPVITATPTNDGSGRAYGFDLYVSRRAASADARLTGWASYTYGVAEMTAYGRTFPVDYDRRHSLSLVGQLRLSRRLELALTGRLASGFPSTPPVGLRVSSTPDELDRDGDGNLSELLPERDRQGRLVYVVDFGDVDNLNTGRQRTYARLDARLTWRPGFAKDRLELYLDVINLLNRTNAGMVDYGLEYDPASGADRPRLVDETEGSIPFLPSLGIHLRF